MEREIQEGRFIEAGKYNDQLYGTSVLAVHTQASAVSQIDVPLQVCHHHICRESTAY